MTTVNRRPPTPSLPATPAAATSSRAGAQPAATAAAARSEFVASGPTALQQLLSRRPELKTRQDLVNYFHSVGGNTWDGAERAGQAVGAVLDELVANRKGSAAAYARQKAPKPAPATTAAPLAAPTASSAHPTLRKGAKGAAVEQLQRSLKAAGFDPGAIDGDFGAKTLKAVKRFQSARGLEVDGIVGPKSWAALAAGAAQPKPETPTTTTPGTTPGTTTPGTATPGTATPGTTTPTTSTPTPTGQPVSARSCSLNVGGVPVYKVEGKKGFAFSSKMSIDADGSPRAYHPQSSKGLDALGNAGKPGNWWGVATDSHGKPFVQKPSDPAPGFYVSTTALCDGAFGTSDPRRYVDSETVPYIAMPPALKQAGCKLGDLVAVRNEKTGKLCYAVIADIGPRDALGEGSMKLAQELGINDSPRSGGASKGIQYVAFPGSNIGWPVTNAQLQAEGARLFAEWGGEAQLSLATRK